MVGLPMDQPFKVEDLFPREAEEILCDEVGESPILKTIRPRL